MSARALYLAAYDVTDPSRFQAEAVESGSVVFGEIRLSGAVYGL
ncbi:hypothetical protein BN873_730002 [Candidatus Competibacter denitrificans Run_A_D11]|uniref:Uncharacterized protein n=1 Tax=Candidatus Competibacter denitrificans Run_A_D11 TaxID=1400863 RepID=W6M8P8_9GAMM|nr:hypothetical protein [Candidatus Competibacter denitrificans]CDI03952.1 hypothetical protein BN873_730002 [Candidatus Competibacter denitrificans Run_A_D11]